MTGKLSSLHGFQRLRKALSGDCLLKGFHLENGGRISLRHSQLCRYVQAFGIRAGAEKVPNFVRSGPQTLAPNPFTTWVRSRGPFRRSHRPLYPGPRVARTFPMN